MKIKNITNSLRDYLFGPKQTAPEITNYGGAFPGLFYILLPPPLSFIALSIKGLIESYREDEKVKIQNRRTGAVALETRLK